MTVTQNFESLLEKMEKAAFSSSRKLSDIHLIAVTKKASLLQMQEAYDFPCKSFGENRLQKALLKMPLLPKDIEWHFIGPIQSNKAADIATHFSVIHSVSSFKVAEIISKEGVRLGKKIRCFIQLSLLNESQKQGFSLEEFLSLEEKLISLSGLKLEGLMTMGCLDLSQTRSCFRSLFQIQEKRKSLFPSLSMGMSGDFEIAIEEGATHIRIGSLLF